MFYLSLFFQKAENNGFKKASWPKFFNVIYLFTYFLLKIGSVAPVDQQINLVSPYMYFPNRNHLNFLR